MDGRAVCERLLALAEPSSLLEMLAHCRGRGRGGRALFVVAVCLEQSLAQSRCSGNSRC